MLALMKELVEPNRGGRNASVRFPSSPLTSSLLERLQANGGHGIIR
jgi:hypothetical protein